MASSASAQRPEVMDQLNWDAVTPQNLNFLKAIGVDCLRVQLPAALGDGADHLEDFKRVKATLEAHGLRLAALHASGLPKDKIVYGREGARRSCRSGSTPSGPSAPPACP